MKNLKKTLNEEVTISIDPIDHKEITLGELLGSVAGLAELASVFSAPAASDTYVKYVEWDDAGKRFRTFNVNSQVSLMEDLSRLQIIQEPDQDGETTASELRKDLQAVYEAVQEKSGSDDSADGVLVDVVKKGGDAFRAEFAFTGGSPKSNVVFVLRGDMPEHAKAELKGHLKVAANFAASKSNTNFAALDDASVGKLFKLHTEMAQLMAKSGKHGVDLMSDPGWMEFAAFNAGLYVASQFSTVGKAVLDKYQAEMESAKALVGAIDQAGADE